MAKKKSCDKCKGSGKCTNCDGSGVVSDFPFGTKKCKRCNKVGSGDCSKCDGKGYWIVH